jgi:predicted metal-dependent enzyme (double-stranded beta helix superfamily)
MARVRSAIQSSVDVPRERAVIETVDRIRAIERHEGVTRPAIAAIKAELIALANRRDLFPRDEFVPPDEPPRDRFYRLSEDADHRFALYLNACLPGRFSPPHDHTTWAVIVGIDGEEENKVYDRTDDRTVPGRGTVKVKHEEVICAGTGMAYMPDDIHSIHVIGTKPILHLHMYGTSIEHLPERIAFNVEAGTYKVYPAFPEILTAPGAARRSSDGRP